MNQPSISLCMIVKNEADHLEKCLRSVQEVVDEIIIVDTGSTDVTLEIARQFQAQISFFEWIDDFAAARNHGLERATGDYILVLDADEFFEASDAQLVKQDIASGKDFYIIRIMNHLDNINTVHQAIRLFKNHRGLQYRGRIHEHLNIESFPGYQNALATPVLHHVGYQDRVYQGKDKHARNLTLLKQAVQENPSGYNYFNLGRQYYSVGEHQASLDALKKSFYKSKDNVYLSTLLNLMMQCLLHLGKYEEGIRLAINSIEGFPKYTDFYDTLGDLYLAYRDQPDAELAFKKCLELGEVTFTETKEGVGTFIPYAKLGQLYFEQGKRVEAVEAAIQSIQIEKNCVTAVEVYFRAMSAAKVPLDDIEKNFKQFYPLQAGVDVLRLITILYNMRHPLLFHYLQEYQLNVEPVLRAIAHQIVGRFEEAKQLWGQAEGEIQPQHVADLLTLAIQLRDESLFERCKATLNLNRNETKLWRSVVRNEAVPAGGVPDTLGKLLLQISLQSLHNQHFDTFEYLSDWLLQCSVALQLDLAKELIKAGYPEVALDLLLRLEPRHQRNTEIYALLGDLFLQQGRFQEALSLYLRLFDLNRDFSTYYRLYRLYEKMGDQEGMQMMMRDIREQFPLSQWGKKGAGVFSPS